MCMSMLRPEGILLKEFEMSVDTEREDVVDLMRS